MKSHLLRALSVSVSLLCTAPLAFAQTFTSDLSTTGNLDIDGNIASFGLNGTNPGYSLIYTDGSPATIDFSASASGANWVWHQGVSSPQLKLSNANVLTLFDPATGVAAITLTPSGATALTTTIGGGLTSELLRLQSAGTDASGTAQRISGQTDVLSGYIDFKRFDASGPITGLTLGTLGGDVLTIRSSGSNDAGNVGIGTNMPNAKLEVVGDLKVTSGTVTTPSVTLSDGSTLTSARSTTLYNAAGQAVATVSSDGKVNFTNGVSVGTDPAATITPASAAYLNQTLVNLGFTETPVEATPVKNIARTGQVNFTAIAHDASYLYVVSQVSGNGSIGGFGFYTGVAGGSVIAKLDQNGTAVWGKVIGGNVNLNSVAVDGSGNVIVAGYFYGTTTGLSSPASNLTAIGGSAGLVVKYNAVGASQWAQAVGNFLDSVAVDGSGNVIVAGFFYGTTTGLSSNLTSAGSSDGLVVKYNAAGASQWAQRVGGNGSDELKSVAVDGSGNVIVAGYFSGTTTGLSSPASNLMANGFNDGLVVKYNASGASQWAQRVGGNSFDELKSVAVDGSGNVIVAGHFSGTTTGLSSPASNLTINGSGCDGLVVKYNAAGASQWAQRVGGNSDDYLNSVAVDGSGNVIVAGRFSGTTTGLSSPASNLTSDGSQTDGLVVKYNAVGASQWAQRFGGSSLDSVDQLVINGNALWSVGSVGEQGGPVVFGDNRIVQGPFVIGWSAFPVVTPVVGTAASLAWGGSVATDDGVALGSSSYADGPGSAAVGAATAIAPNAFASGTSSAQAESATAMGSFTIAKNNAATALGSYTTASGFASTALGYYTTASGHMATAMGSISRASGDMATAMGQETSASGYVATAMGDSTTASGYVATAMGSYTTANGYAATATGEYTSASGYASTAMGSATAARGYAATAMGVLNVAHGEDPNTPQSTDDLLVVGNGDTAEWIPSNAFAVHRNGNVRAAGDLEVRGVIRIKPAGDLSMGTFTTGANPADPATGLNVGLRYPNE